MADLDKAVANQLANIEQRSGRTIAELVALVNGSGLAKHGEQIAMLKSTLGLGHGDANTLVHHARRSREGAAGAAPPRSGGEVLDALYVGPKVALRPIHDALLAAMRDFGDFEEAPKKTYVSYRRKKQFAMIGPATNSRVEVGINARELDGDARLESLPPGQMSQYKVKLTDVAQVDAQLVGWIRAAYESAG